MYPNSLHLELQHERATFMHDRSLYIVMEKNQGRVRILKTSRDHSNIKILTEYFEVI